MYMSARRSAIFLFFQAEDGIRDTSVTGVQTCALPILVSPREALGQLADGARLIPRRRVGGNEVERHPGKLTDRRLRSEERRVGKECRSRWAEGQDTKKEELVDHREVQERR